MGCVPDATSTDLSCVCVGVSGLSIPEKLRIPEGTLDGNFVKGQRVRRCRVQLISERALLWCSTVRVRVRARPRESESGVGTEGLGGRSRRRLLQALASHPPPRPRARRAPC
eukprot:2091494-Rhodomonas_salina.5